MDDEVNSTQEEFEWNDEDDIWVKPNARIVQAHPKKDSKDKTDVKEKLTPMIKHKKPKVQLPKQKVASDGCMTSLKTSAMLLKTKTAATGTVVTPIQGKSDPNEQYNTQTSNYWW